MTRTPPSPPADSSGHPQPATGERAANRLARETSPYLLQHAGNPVDWYPWGDEALARARDEDRPILLSIGYSACHWCHVMERESFEDGGTAALMNERFVNIKVDREERPDLDAIYMRAVQSITGQGGWPLTAFLTPQGLPYYGGTYFPPEPRHGMPSFRQVLDAAGRAYTGRKAEVREAASRMRGLLERSMTPPDAGRASPDDRGARTGLARAACGNIARGHDSIHGGFGRAPKFPQPMVLELMLRVHRASGDDQLLSIVTHTLRRMARGGIHDQLGGGFHRYTVDAAWLVPHFEKMLYDNALLASAYLQAHLYTGDAEFLAVVEKTLAYMLTDLRSPDGGFYSARDADSEGEEGLFYLWTAEEVDELLDPSAARLFRRCYDVTPAGNFEGRNILHLPHDPESVARAEGLAPEELDAVLARASAVLLDARARREPPFRDEKVIVAWNGFAIRVLAEAGAALGRREYVRAAEQAGEFILAELRHGGRLLRSHKDRPSPVGGFLEDYASLAGAFLALHEATLRAAWLDRATELAEALVQGFFDRASGLFYDTHRADPALVVRPRDATDNATPSGNSLAAEVLLRLGRLLDREDLRALAAGVLASEAAAMARFPSAYGKLLTVADAFDRPGVEVVIEGDPDDDATRALLQAAHRRYLPDRLVTGDEAGRTPRAPWRLEAGGTGDGAPRAHVCHDYTCQRPVVDPRALADQLDAAGEP